MGLTLFFASVLFLIVGIIGGYFFRHILVLREIKEKKSKSDKIINEAREQANNIKYRAKKEAKDIAYEQRKKAEKEVDELNRKIKEQERNLISRESKLELAIRDIESREVEIENEKNELKNMSKKVDGEIKDYKKKQLELVNKLSEVSGYSREQAKNEIMNNMQEEAKIDFAKKLRLMEEDTKEQSEFMAKRIIGISIQRFAGEYVAEKTISTVNLPSDDIKGRLIGREGRNIRAFEQICGVDLIVDDTPEVVVISSFNVVRREVARRTIEKLIEDGRIHPAKIDEFHEKSCSEMSKQLLDLGQKAQMEIGVHGIHPEILKLVGALNWRTSYIQNQYQHALEAAFICGSMASEMGLNVKQARRAGLLHDIGKVIDASMENSHAVVGADFAKKYGESPDVVHAIRAHHDDEKPESVLAHLVAASDALSGARPGARKAMMESYITRLSDIEKIVNSFDGVSKSYAISGGREVKVFVENSRVDDDQTVMLSRDIAKKIESDMSYPGTIKVTVLREIKAVGVAR